MIDYFATYGFIVFDWLVLIMEDTHEHCLRVPPGPCKKAVEQI